MPTNVGRVETLFEDINRNGVTEPELRQAQNKVASRIVLRGERPMGRLGSLGGNWQYREEYRPIAADLEDIASVTIADIRRLLAEHPLRLQSTAAVGPRESLS
jgi:predicted Zn-dependent peptidase